MSERETKMKTEVVEVDDRFGPEFAGRYVFREISWMKRSRIITRYTKYHPITGQLIHSDLPAIQAETIWAALVEHPSSLTLDKLLSEGEDGIPVELGEFLSSIVNRLCGLTLEEAKNSSGR